MELLAIWLLCGVACAVVASGKKRSKFGWFMIGMIVGPLGILLALVVAKRS